MICLVTSGVNMSRHSVNFNFEILGAEIANMDADEQFKFFRGMAKEILSWNTVTSAEMQGIYALKNLPKEYKKILLKFFSELSEE